MSRARVDVVTILAMVIATFVWFSVAYETSTSMVARVEGAEVALVRPAGGRAGSPSLHAPAAGCAVSGDLVGNGDPAEVYAMLCR